MRIAIAYHRHSWDRGIERKSAELAERFARGGHRVEYICAQAEPRRASGVTFVKVPAPVGPASITLWAFNLFARRALRHCGCELSLSFGSVVGCDIVVAESPHGAGLDVMTRQGKQATGDGRNLGLADFVRFRMERMNFAKRRYVHVIASSRRVQQELGAYYDVPESDVTVIPSGVNTEEFAPEENAPERLRLRASLGYGFEDRVLLFVGNEFARKGLRTIIGALPLLSEENVRLLVCGGGVSAPYEQLARELGVASRVRFEGHIARIAPFFAASDIFLLPTLHEPFGLVILEAMASGLPVVVSKTAGVAEDHLTDGKEGLLLDDPTDPAELARKVRTILEEPARGIAFGEAGREKASRLTWDLCAEKYLEIFSEVVARKASGSGTTRTG